MGKSSVLMCVAVAVLLVVAVALYLVPSWSLEDMLLWLQQAPAGYVVVAVFVAPLFGVPLSPLLTALTIVLPFWSACWIVALTIFLHHLLVLLLMRSPVAAWLRVKMLEKRLLPAPRQHKKWSDNLLFILATTWIPGVSYIFKPVYLMLSGVGTKLFLFFGTLSQLVAALPYLLLGQAAGSGHFFWLSIALFVVFALAWLGKRYVGARGLSVEGGGQK